MASASPVRNSSESPGRKEVKMKAVSKKMITATAMATQSPKALIISWASSQFNALQPLRPDRLCRLSVIPQELSVVGLPRFPLNTQLCLA